MNEERPPGGIHAKQEAMIDRLCKHYARDELGIEECATRASPRRTRSSVGKLRSWPASASINIVAMVRLDMVGRLRTGG